MGEVIQPTMNDANPVSEFQGPNCSPNMVETAVRAVDQHQFSHRKLTRKEDAWNTGTGPRIENTTVPRGTVCSKRGTHRQGEPGGVFPQFFDAGRTQRSHSTGGNPRLLEGRR